MLPFSPMNNSANSPLANSKNLGQPSHGMALGCVEFPDLDYLSCIQFCRVVPKTIMGAMFNAVPHILFSCVPPQIQKKIVGALAVIMATFQSRRTWSHKGGKHKSVDFGICRLTVFPQIYKKITLDYAWVQDSLGHRNQKRTLSPSGSFPKRPDLPMVANLVARESCYVFPLFDRWVKLVGTHGRGLLNRLRLWGEPLSLFMQGCGSFFYIINSDNMP